MMNHELIENILKESAVRGAQRMALIALASLADEARWVDSSHPEIAMRAGVEVRALQGTLIKLEQIGAIHVERNAGKMTPRGRQNLYFLRLWGAGLITPGDDFSGQGVNQIAPYSFISYIQTLLESLEREKEKGAENCTPSEVFHRLIQNEFDVVRDRAAADQAAKLIRHYGAEAVAQAIEVAVGRGILLVHYVGGVVKRQSLQPTRPALSDNALRVAMNPNDVVIS